MSLLESKPDLLLNLNQVVPDLEPLRGEGLGFLQDFLNLMLKVGGTISIMNESKLFNRQLVEFFHDLYQLGASYSIEMVEQATLYTKIQSCDGLLGLSCMRVLSASHFCNEYKYLSMLFEYKLDFE